MINGNTLGLMMFVAVSPVAIIGGFLLKLPDPITMSGVGITLTLIDLIMRVRARPAEGWLFEKRFGGYLLFAPVWIIGICVVILNVIKALFPTGKRRGQ